MKDKLLSREQALQIFEQLLKLEKQVQSEEANATEEDK